MDDVLLPHLIMVALVMVYFWSVTLGALLLVTHLRRRRLAHFELAYSRHHPAMAYQRSSIMFAAETQEVPALQVYDPPRLRHINPSEQVSLAITPDEAAASAPQPESNLQKLIHHLTKAKTTATVPTVTPTRAD